MESKSFIQTLQGKNERFKHATSLEDVLCLSTMVSDFLLQPSNDVDDARLKWLNDYAGECNECPSHQHCLACIINE